MSAAWSGVPGGMAIRITVGDCTDTHTRVTVDRDGAVSSALMPHDPDEDEPLELVGDVRILLAASAVYDGKNDVYEMTDAELCERGDGRWGP